MDNYSRGQILYDYVRLIDAKEPKFFSRKCSGMVCKNTLI